MESPTSLIATTPGTSFRARIAAGHKPALFASSDACERRFTIEPIRELTHDKIERIII